MDQPDPFSRFLTAEALASHSSDGERALVEAAQRFFVVRLFYERHTTRSLTEARFDELAHEAWSLFILGSLQGYNTWLNEVAGSPSDSQFQYILDGSREVFHDIAEQIKEDMIEMGIVE